MWGLAPDYQMLQADGQGEERTRLMVALIGLQKAPKPGNRKKRKLPWLHKVSDQQGYWNTAYSALDLGAESQNQAFD